MYLTHNLIIKHKGGLLNLASELQSVSKACKIMACHATHFIAIKSWLKPMV